MKPKYLFDKDEWLLAENIPDMDIYFSRIFFSSFVNASSFPFIKKYKKVLGLFKKFHLDFYFGKKDSHDVAESIMKALIERPEFGSDINKNIVIWSNKLSEFAKSTAKLPLKEFSNKQLWDLYNKQDTIHTKLYTYGWLPVSVDMFHNNFTNKLKSYLYSVCDSKAEAEQAFVILTTPSKKTILAEEREQFLEIYEKYKKQLNNKVVAPELYKKLVKHAENWGHLGYIYAGNVKPFEPEYYLKELRELVQTKVNGKKLLAIEAKQLKIAKQQQVKLIKKLKISLLYKRLFETAKDFSLTKLSRRHAQLLDLYLMHTTLLSEIAKRLKLTRYQVQSMVKEEVKLALVNGKYNKKKIAERLKHCAMYDEKGFEKIFLGSMEKKIRGTVNDFVDKTVNEFSGQTAQPGFASGAVKIIIRAKDMAKMNKGDILVSIATDPDMVPAMKKAAAIITEQGGITAHAAIVSRELGTPCIIGTKVATKVLKDGDIVEVDANNGIVRKLSK